MSRPRRPALRVHPLEPRDVPAAIVSAGLNAAGVLALLGDDMPSAVTIRVDTATTQTILTPDANTDVGAGPGVPNPLAGIPTSLTADLKGGDDVLKIDGGTAFRLTGPAAVHLGDGNNTLEFVTTQALELAGLKVTARDGTDRVTVEAGAGLGEVTGPAVFDYGLGESHTDLSEIKFSGPAGLRVRGVADTTFMSSLRLANSPVTGQVTTGLPGLYSAVRLIDSPAGGVTVTGRSAVLILDGSDVTGNVRVSGGFSGQLDATNVQVTGNVTLTGSYSARAILLDTRVTGDVSVKSGLQCAVYPDGAFQARNVTVRASVVSVLDVRGTSATVNGNLNVSGGTAARVLFNTSALSVVKGNVNTTGSWFGDEFTANEHFRADGNVNLNLGNGDNRVDIGNGAAAVLFGGNLSVRTGTGRDRVALDNVSVAGATSIRTGAGADVLRIDNGSILTGTFFADLSAGDDQIAIAQTAAATVPVTFTGKATILAGAGNDDLKLGNAAGANSRAEFAFAPPAANRIDGGPGYNTFDDEAGSFTPGITLPNWTDPT